jgi:hypothetical protein
VKKRRGPLGQFDLFASRRARDEGIARSTRRNGTWCELALRKIGDMSEFEGTGEDLRLRLLLREGLMKPKSPHAWGSLCYHAVRRGLLVEISPLGQMKQVSSHARRTAIYTLRQ